jgi:sulfate adenylyltransferase
MVTKLLDEREMCDLECLLNGSFAPLTGYMGHGDYESCLSSMRLEDGSVFPIPIVCGLEAAVDVGSVVTLQSGAGAVVATLTVRECWQPDLAAEWSAVFGSTDTNHPYISYYGKKWAAGVWYVSGDLEVVAGGFDFHGQSYPGHRLTPAEGRGLGPWIGFQTRNPLHRSHIDLILEAQRKFPGVPVLLHPVEGVTQECDVPFSVRMACYKGVLVEGLGDGARLSVLPLSMRMAGPREAVWHAVIRRNYGCTHFIVGRDHAGPSYKTASGATFYESFAAQELALSMADAIGITIVALEEVAYCPRLDIYIPLSAARAVGVETKSISGTEFRRLLESGEEVPAWYSYPSVIRTLKEFYGRKAGLCVYFVGLSGAGKTTLAAALKRRIEEERPSRTVTHLDADMIRTHLSKGLGFSRTDRSTNVRRIGYVASEIVKHGGICVVANIAPYEEDRQFNRQLIAGGGVYVEVFVNTDLSVCESRDVKGLYKAARAGTLPNFTGISDPFEPPVGAELVLKEGSVAEMVDQIWAQLLQKLD